MLLRPMTPAYFRKTKPSGPKIFVFCILAALPSLVYAQGVVISPATPPSVPAGYCASMYTELQGDLQAFNTVLATPPTWTPIPFAPGASTIYAANLQWANGNTGPSVGGTGYLASTVQPQLQALKALGVQAISVPVLFPILYEPFYGSQSAYQPYLTFYTQVAQAIRAEGLKLIIDNEILFSNDTAAGWSNMNAFYGTLTWPEYIAARATMAATIEQYMQPDYLMLANEPDTEALQTGQINLNIPADAAAMVQAEITAVKNYLSTATVTPYPKLGAGFGTWMTQAGVSSLLNYLNAFTPLPLDYIDYHLLQIGTVAGDNFLNNSLTISQMAAAAGKPVAITQAWMEDETNAEVNVLNIDIVRARGPFSFWAPLNLYFMQTAQALANYTNMLYLVPQFPVYMFAQQTYGGTVANLGSLNCTCTTTSCSDYDIGETENSLATAADQISVYTDTGVNYYKQLVTTPDLTPPTQPPSLTGSAGFTTATLSWGASTDNIGVAGYNVYRCSPPAEGQPCTGVYLATTTLPGYSDSSLTSGVPYNYQVQAFDFANNNSPLSAALSLQTYITSAGAATNLVATTVSAQEITLTWSPPSNAGASGSYLIYMGTSLSNLQDVATRQFPTTTYTALSLAAATTYYFGIVAVQQGIHAPMSNTAYAITRPLPTPPNNVAGTPYPTKIALTWQETVQPNGLPINDYLIYQGTTPGNVTKVGTVKAPTTAFTTSTTSDPLTPNTTYYFEIVAVDTGVPADDSLPSDAIAVTTDSLPNAPINVTATANSTTQVTVTWTETVPTNGLPISSYTVFRGATPTTITTSLGSTTALKFVDTKASVDTTYYYAVEAKDTSQDVSPLSAAAEVTTPALPAAPVNVAAAANSSTRVTVTWVENIPTNGLPISSYTVYRGATPTTITTDVGATTALKFVDTKASANTIYYYAVTATDSGRDVSPASSPAEVTTPATPAAPVNVLATPNSTTQITVTWAENIPTNGLPIASYTINWGTSPTSLTNSAKRNTPTFVDTGLTPATTYYFQITATDTDGDASPASATVNATTP
ncbi:MAG TPA: fibronectin type III domain-containing protein [Bryobacteraceae bacterium]|nr:fibronectin type III domain-containing protein [Bryobacteraceae bacterium]